MTVAELRALLETLPERFDETEVLVYGGRGLSHIESIELDRRKGDAGYWSSMRDGVPADRLARKVRIRVSSHRRPETLWYDPPPDWRLFGWWPREAAEIGMVP